MQTSDCVSIQHELIDHHTAPANYNLKEKEKMKKKLVAMSKYLQFTNTDFTLDLTHTSQLSVHILSLPVYLCNLQTFNFFYFNRWR